MLLRLKPPTVIRLGLVGLVLANLSRWYATKHLVFTEDVTDGLNGFLYGIAIALMLLGIWMQGRPEDQTARRRK